MERPVYLDVESLPDRDLYYLIGVRVKTGDVIVQHSFWADDIADERRVWSEFLGILSTMKKPVLVHYGSFETTFLRRMSERYGGAAEESGSRQGRQDGGQSLNCHFRTGLFSILFQRTQGRCRLLGFRVV